MKSINNRNKKKYPGIIDNGNGTVTLDYRDKQHKRHRMTVKGTPIYGYQLLMKLKVQMEEETFYPEKAT